MPTKVSEKKLFAGMILFVTGLALLLQVKLFHSPVLVSEKALALAVVSIALVVIAVGLLRRAFVRV